MQNYLPKHVASLSALTMLLLTACGGGAGSASVQSSQQIVGTVIDGYIEGAKVCLDLNSNGVCDKDEPTSVTYANGAYVLDVGSANTTGLNVIAEISDSAKDSDDAGKTLASAGKSAYTMAAAADKAAVITPLTTLIAGTVKTDNLTPAQARTQVIAQLGLAEDTNPYEDYIAQGNQAVHYAAMQVAGELQYIQRSLTTTNGNSGDRWSQLQQARVALEKSAGSVSKISPSPLNLPANLTSVATGQLFAYKMVGVQGRPVNATAILFQPKTPAPSSGWPLVVFGHGTTGVGQQCAPSVALGSSGNLAYSDMIAMMVARGVVVVAPDYEGLGAAEMGVTAGHPYLNLRSAGQSMALAAVAARKMLPNKLSGAWAAVGHSQGGHAALAGAQFAALATQLDSRLSYKGAVAAAPASNLGDSFNLFSNALGSTTRTSMAATYSEVAYLVQGTQSTLSPVNAPSVLGSNLLALYNNFVQSSCADAFQAIIANDIDQYAGSTGASPQGYVGVNIAAVNTPKIAGLLDGNEPGRVRLPGKTLIVQGSSDTVVLPFITNKLVATMQAKGSDVALSYQNSPAATHSGVLYLLTTQSTVSQFLTSLFGGVASGV